MDGVGGLTQTAIAPGETFNYEFTLRQRGHAHVPPAPRRDDADGAGHDGHVRRPPARAAAGRASTATSRIMLHEWRIDPGAARPDPIEMTDFNVLTMNGKAFPGTAPLVVQHGRARAHPLRQPERDGPPPDPPARLPVPHHRDRRRRDPRVARSGRRRRCWCRSGSTRTIEFVADEPGDWAMHCHMTHHVMNQMGHGMPNLIGVKHRRPGRARSRQLLPGYMTMGQDGMGDMAEMEMPMPTNSIPMVGGKGPLRRSSPWAACSPS